MIILFALVRVTFIRLIFEMNPKVPAKDEAYVVDCLKLNPLKCCFTTVVVSDGRNNDDVLFTALKTIHC